MRVALYARVSTRDKDQNPETQLLALRQYAANHGWVVTTEYVDQASAADLRGRARWRELIEQVRPHHFDAVMVLRLDRAFRSSKETYDTLSYFSDHKVGFVSITQPIDTTSSTGKLLLGILAAMAEFESNLIRERVKEGMARAQSEGKRVGRPAGAKDKKKRRRRGYFLRYAE